MQYVYGLFCFERPGMIFVDSNQDWECFDYRIWLSLYELKKLFFSLDKYCMCVYIFHLLEICISTTAHDLHVSD
jgi:hypothetical protein